LRNSSSGTTSCQTTESSPFEFAFSQCSVEELGLNVPLLTKLIKQEFLTPLRKEFAAIKTKKGNLTLDPYLMEYITSKSCLDGRYIGNLNFPIDVLLEDQVEIIGLDVVCVSSKSKSTTTNEKILCTAQPSGLDRLSSLFECGASSDILSYYLDLFISKMEKVSDKFYLDNVYFVFYCSVDKQILLVCFRLDIKLLCKAVAVQMNKEKTRMTVLNLFDPNLAHVYISRPRAGLHVQLRSGALVSPLTKILVKNIHE
jgi:hypothetical protein